MLRPRIGTEPCIEVEPCSGLLEARIVVRLETGVGGLRGLVAAEPVDAGLPLQAVLGTGASLLLDQRIAAAGREGEQGKKESREEQTGFRDVTPPCAGWEFEGRVPTRPRSPGPRG